MRVAGEFVWHSHPGMDELFVVLDGELTIDLREPSGTGTGERAVVLRAGDVYTVPADVPHRPRSAGGARLLLVEPAGMVNTGDFTGAVPEHIDRTEGRPL
ncbi:MAG: cupin domain-containing protein [Kineosporiaceae bacterium]